MKSFTKKFKRKLRILWRIAKKKPRFLMRYVLMMTMFRFWGAAVMALLAFLPIPDLTSYRMSDLLRYSPKISVDFAAIRAMPHEVFASAKYLAGNPDVIVSSIKSLPMEIRNLVNHFTSVLGARWREWKKFIKSLWPLSRTFARLWRFIREHYRSVPHLMREGFRLVLSFVLLKVFLLFVIPLLSIGIISMIGIGLLLPILQLVANLIAAFLGKKITHHIFVFYKKFAKYIPVFTSWRRNLSRYTFKAVMQANMIMAAEMEKQKTSLDDIKKILEENQICSSPKEK